MTLSKSDLKSIMPSATAANIEFFCDPLNSVFSKYEINTPLRISAFLAQIAVESGSLTYTRELWGPTPDQVLYERDFNHAWPPTKMDLRNESAFSLGNTEIGDGKKFRGHGLIQITGRSNHLILSKKFGVDFIAKPELLEGPVYACEAAGDFWASHMINIFADQPDFDGVCDSVNRGRKTKAIGDSNGYKDRLEFYERAKKILNA